mgnify:CR=1 FL=1
MKAEVFIRADGGPKIGLGHLVRCSALANMLKDDFSISFFCKEIPEKLQVEFQQNGYFVVIIDHEDQFFSQISGESIVVLDGDGFDTDYQQKIKVSGARLVCIDSLHNRRFLADLIISHAPGLTSDNYKAQPYTRFALGIKYALLRPSFLEQVKKTRILTKIENVFICFGGADPLHITEKVLQVISGIERFKKIIVITGTEYSSMQKLRELTSKDSRIIHRSSLNEQEMFSSIHESDIAVVPASGILLEVLSVGLPAITGYYVTDQKEPALNFSKLGLAYNIGDFRADIKDDLIGILNSISVGKAQKMVDIQKQNLKGANYNIRNLFMDFKYNQFN